MTIQLDQVSRQANHSAAPHTKKELEREKSIPVEVVNWMTSTEGARSVSMTMEPVSKVVLAYSGGLDTACAVPWLRENYGCEVVAMVSSFGISLVLLVLKRKCGIPLSTHHALLLTIGITTISWVLTAFLGPQTDRGTLLAFYRKVRYFGPGWRHIRQEASNAELSAKDSGENIPLALLGWTAGCATIWSSLFTVGNVLYGRWPQAGLLLLVFGISGTVLIRVINRLWNTGKAGR